MLNMSIEVTACNPAFGHSIIIVIRNHVNKYLLHDELNEMQEEKETDQPTEVWSQFEYRWPKVHRNSEKKEKENAANSLKMEKLQPSYVKSRTVHTHVVAHGTAPAAEFQAHRL